ncbi:MAG: beta-galactosidase [Blautia sp.]|nr:beta-galactosidase [Blautia sp.]
MERKILFPQIDGILHGGDYNPEQWLDRPDILVEDIRLMKEAGVNCVTLGVFSWSAYEPTEGSFFFGWLMQIMDKLYENGIYTILATASGAKPAWLDERYPEALRVDSYGRRAHHGVRHNHCMSAPIFRKKVSILLNQLIDAVGSHPGLIMWHISNEFGGECFCPHCVARFQNYLAEKFDHDIAKLNRAWWTAFWSHSYNDFSQIEPPYRNGEYSIMGLNLEWKRFTTWSMTDYMKSEIAILKEKTPNIPVTTNYMKRFPGLDYRVMSRELDVVSWDSYPPFHNDWESFADTMGENAFDHALMRCMKKDRPFMLMESAPGLVNWHGVNKMKRPGVHRLASLQAVALGSDTVQYFQWRKGRGSYEQYHGAVLDHFGSSDTRIFKEVVEVGADLQKLSKVRGTVVKSPVALLFDWDNRWAIEDMRGLSEASKKYEETCVRAYRNLMRLGVDIDVIPSDDPLDGYDVVVAPMLYMLKPKVADSLRRFVTRGGQLLATYLTGYVDMDQLNFLGGFPGDGLKELFGVVSEEIDSLYPSDENQVNFTDGSTGLVREYAEMLRLLDAEVVGTYLKDYYGGMPAVTVKQTGDGKAWYVAARLDDVSMIRLYEKLFEAAGLPVRRLPENVEYHSREAGNERFSFYLNCGTGPAFVKNVKGTELLTGEEISSVLTLPPYGAAVLWEDSEDIF